MTINKILNIFKEIVENGEDLHSALHDDYCAYKTLEKKLSMKELDKICLADGASKIVIVFLEEDFVLKWTSSTRYDEATREYKIYQEAVKTGIEFIFPKTEFCAEIGGIKFYKQAKIQSSVSDLSYEKKEKYRKRTRNVSRKMCERISDGFYVEKFGGCNRDLNELWVRMLVLTYGKRVCKLLEDFTKVHRINDLHGGNIGYYNDKPIILDFAGYFR